MTEYRTIHVVKRRRRVRVRLPVLATTSVQVYNNDDTRITRGGNIRITRGGNTRVARNTTETYPRIIHVPKRRFRIRGRRQL